MFAGAAREAVFANPEVIRRVREGFIPVSVGAAHMQRPARGTEQQLLHAIGRSGPAPQGIAVLNADGQVLDWVLTFRDDPAVLEFLDYAKKQFQEHPDRSRPFQTERYQQFPGHRRDDMAAHDFVVAEGATHHHPNDRCPAGTLYPPGTIIAKVTGRRVNADGTLIADTVNQETYAQDRFIIDPGLQEGLADAVAQAGGQRVRVPDNLTRLWAGYAYLGMLDVRPVNNPAGAKTERSEIEFWAESDPGKPGWVRLSGKSDVVVVNQGDGPARMHFANSIKLDWTGYVRMDGRRIVSLLLSADGAESLRWGTGDPQSERRPPEVASLPGGRPINWSGQVRFGIIGEPAKQEQTSTAAIAAAPRGTIREIIPRLHRRLQNLQRDGIKVEAVTLRMPEFQRLMNEQRFAEAESVLDRILESLDK